MYHFLQYLYHFIFIIFTRRKRVCFCDTRFWAGHFAALSTPTFLPCICMGSHFLNMHGKSFSVKYLCAIYCSSSLHFICFQRNKMSISVFWATYLPSCFPRDEHGVCLLHRNAKRNCTKKTVGAFLAIDRTDFLPIDFSRPRLTYSSNSVRYRFQRSQAWNMLIRW